MDEVCYKVRDQWLRYQYEEVKDDWYKRDTNDVPTTSKVSQASYWQDAMERCGLVEGGNENFESCYKRIDHYWRKIGELVDEDGGKKYTELANLALTVCSLSHGNAAQNEVSPSIKLYLKVMATLFRKTQLCRYEL